MKTSCKIYPGAKDKDGYGWQRKNGERKAHRAAWVEANGPIPEGMWILHSCDNPSCIEPTHLFLGTAKDNSDDMRKKGRQHYPGFSSPGELNPNHKLTEEDVKHIRSVYKWGLGPVLAKEYGVHRFTINRIVRGEKWREVLIDAQTARYRDI
jgi:hypothetical protein